MAEKAPLYIAKLGTLISFAFPISFIGKIFLCNHFRRKRYKCSLQPQVSFMMFVIDLSVHTNIFFSGVNQLCFDHLVLFFFT